MKKDCKKCIIKMLFEEFDRADWIALAFMPFWTLLKSLGYDGTLDLIMTGIMATYFGSRGVTLLGSKTYKLVKKK